MSKKSDDVASAASIEDAFCEWRGELFSLVSCNFMNCSALLLPAKAQNKLPAV